MFFDKKNIFYSFKKNLNKALQYELQKTRQFATITQNPKPTRRAKMNVLRHFSILFDFTSTGITDISQAYVRVFLPSSKIFQTDAATLFSYHFHKANPDLQKNASME